MIMTKREIFEKVKTHLLKQGKQSIAWDDNEDEDLCLYRGPDGLMCAVGCLIKDEFYTPELEGCVAGDPLVLDALAKSRVIGPIFHIEAEAISLMERLQLVHDNMETLAWVEELNEIDVELREEEETENEYF